VFEWPAFAAVSSTVCRAFHLTRLCLRRTCLAGCEVLGLDCQTVDGKSTDIVLCLRRMTQSCRTARPWTAICADMHAACAHCYSVGENAKYH